jgi:chemotaxis protein CheZ
MSGAGEMELKELRRQVCLLQAELVTMRHPRAPTDRLMLAARELDAIVETTASATDNILDTAEEIGITIDALQRKSVDPAIEEAADKLGDLISRLYSECSFQDLTGQRIRRVIGTIDFIEQRLAKMVAVFGAEYEKLPLPEVADASGDAALLNGPQLDSPGVSQAEIDRLFP